MSAHKAIKSDGSHRRYELYGADTETDHNKAGTRAWVAQWAIVGGRDRSNDKSGGRKNRKEEQIYQGYDLNTLMAQMRQFEDRDSVYTYVYFHNLNYDVQFLWDELYIDLLNHENSLIIGNNGRVIAVKTGNLEIRDSMAKISMKLRDIAPLVKLEKLDSPRGNFEAGWSKDLTDADFQYVIQDARIVFRAMQWMHKQGDNHMTAAGDAWNELRSTYNRVHGGYKGTWTKHYPLLTYAIDARIRSAYFGGLNLSFHKGLNIATEDMPIVHEDVNSMYPSVLRYDPLPYGEPIVITDISELKNYDLYVIFALFKLTLKNGMIPWFKPKNCLAYIDDWNGQWKQPIVEMDDYEPMALCSVDIETLKIWYDVKIKIPRNFWAYGFHSEIGAHAEYVDKWYNAKAECRKNHDELGTKQAKIKLNSCYGRFALRVEEEVYTIEYDEELDYHQLKKHVVEIEDEFAEITKDAYVPMGVFITAWARRRLLNGVLSIGPLNLIHADTDSMIHYGKPSNFSHGSELGAWKLENYDYTNDRSNIRMIYEGGFKRYIEVIKDGEPKNASWFSMAGAGIPHDTDRNHVPIGMGVELYDDPTRIYDDDLILGHERYRIMSDWLRQVYIAHGMNPDDVNTMKLVQDKVKGGAILRETTFNIRNLIKRR